MIKVEYRFETENLKCLSSLFVKTKDFNEANDLIYRISGLRTFFPNEDYYSWFLEFLNSNHLLELGEERREYGDFQTPDSLTERICIFLAKEIKPKILIEPTFGKGSFLMSALKHLTTLNHIFGVEIYEQYIWHSKFRILEYFIENPDSNRPSIWLFHADIFDFNWKEVHDFINDSLLILGNPPWVTNSELSSLNSRNVPPKSNFKNHKGYDAITGKGNFDIGEFVVLNMLKEFSSMSGDMAMLLKKSVIKNLVYNLKKNSYKIDELKSFSIDAEKYFDASVDASLFTCNFNSDDSHLTCSAFDFLEPNTLEKSFGWLDNKFISDIKLYRESNCLKYDGLCPIEWRQGVKHDNSKVFEIRRIKDKFRNGLNEEISIEEGRIYGIVKSSELKGGIIEKPKKGVIITQTYLGEETSKLAESYPKLYNYLCSKLEVLKSRKSSIYKNKPEFSIFGIGDYSFKPYKVAISGLYKQPSFTLVMPENGKPLMLDDTCYFLGFDNLSDAVFTWILLTDERTLNLLECISFRDSKRPYTKDILMRIALDVIAADISFEDVAKRLQQKQDGRILISLTFEYQDWETFLCSISRNKTHQDQLALFHE